MSIWSTRDLSRSTFRSRAPDRVEKSSWECFREGGKPVRAPSRLRQGFAGADTPICVLDSQP